MFHLKLNLPKKFLDTLLHFIFNDLQQLNKAKYFFFNGTELSINISFKRMISKIFHFFSHKVCHKIFYDIYIYMYLSTLDVGRSLWPINFMPGLYPSDHISQLCGCCSHWLHLCRISNVPGFLMLLYRDVDIFLAAKVISNVSIHVMLSVHTMGGRLKLRRRKMLKHMSQDEY